MFMNLDFLRARFGRASDPQHTFLHLFSAPDTDNVHGLFPQFQETHVEPHN